MLTQLPLVERLSVIEAAIHQLRQEWRVNRVRTCRFDGSGGAALLEDYLHDSELTAFTRDY
jgi:hypothetical protein